MKLKSLFSLLGFEIYRKSKKNKIKFDSSQKPLYIELVGVSGVGKSTIYQKAIQNQFNFWTLNDFKENNPKVNFQAVLDGQSFYQDLAKYQWDYIQKMDILETDKFRIAHWNYKTLLDDAAVHLHNKNSIVLSDEGILHNFQFALLNSYKSDPNSLNDFIKNRAVVYCYSSVDGIVEQILRRKEETGRIVSHHKGKSIEELYDIVKRDLEEKEEFLEIMFNMGIPILRINTQDSLELNSKKINKFIEELSN